jgi:hypothetical protein
MSQDLAATAHRRCDKAYGDEHQTPCVRFCPAGGGGRVPGRRRGGLPSGSPGQEGLAAFEWYRLSQVNASVSDERLWSLRRDGFSAVYADIGKYLEVADQPESRS